MYTVKVLVNISSEKTQWFEIQNLQTMNRDWAIERVTRFLQTYEIDWKIITVY